MRVLTFGSSRQSRQLGAAAVRAGYDVEVTHVSEDVRDWVPREIDDIVADAVAAKTAWGTDPDALVNLGRATVPDGIRRIAAAHERLRAGRGRDTPPKVVGPSEFTARVWGDKALIAEELSAMGLPLPRTVVVDPGSPASVDRLVTSVKEGELTLPLVLKVTHLTGGSGMRCVEDEADLPAAVRSLAPLSTGQLVACEFAAGDEVSVDVLRLGTQTLVYPPGFKRNTDLALTHADHKIKVNGLVRTVPEFERDVRAIAERFDLQGFFSVEGVVTSHDPRRWVILEGATRLTNNLELQDGSLRIDSLEAVARFIAGDAWLPESGGHRLALSIPIYRHRGAESLEAIQALPWVRQAKLEDLSHMPGSRDSRVRLTVKMVAGDLAGELGQLSAMTGDTDLTDRVTSTVDRMAERYGD